MTDGFIVEFLCVIWNLDLAVKELVNTGRLYARLLTNDTKESCSNNGDIRKTKQRQ